MMSLLLFLAASAVLVAAQTPERCVAPPSWHSHVFRAVREGSVFTAYRERFAYDIANLRFRYLAGLVEEREPAYAHYFFYKEKYSLRANFTTRTCMRYYLNETFRPFGVPYNARYVDTVEIGSNIGPGLGLEVAVWEGQTENGGYFSSSFTTKRTQPGEPWNGEYCLPVSDAYIRGDTYYSSHRFFDVEAGFNPDDFVPPDFC